MTEMTRGTAGTASRGYLVVRRPHPFTPTPLEPGARDLCRICGGERPAHPIPNPRKASE